MPLYNLVYAIGAMIGIGYATRYTLDKSLNRKDVNDYFSNAILWLIFFSLPFVIVGTSLFNGVSLGLQPLASRYALDEDKTIKVKIYKYSRNIGIFMALILVIGVWIFDEQLVAIFNEESVEELASIATEGLKLYFLGFLIASINLVKSGYYSAIGRAGISSVISICRGVIAIIVFALVLSNIFGIIGVWISFPVAEIFTIIVAFICEYVDKKREI